MGKRGPKPKWREFVWSPELAYAVGLFATDGCLFNDGRHLSMVSRDIQQLQNFKQCLNLNTKISFKSLGRGKEQCAHVQLSDVALYQFFLEIGLTPNKSKTIGPIKIPKRYFFDFLRGAIDGDGSFYSYYDTRWRSSFMFYLSLVSASKTFLDWIHNELQVRLKVNGCMTSQKIKGNKSALYHIKYAKADSLKIIKKMYYSPTVVCLSRKKDKIEKAIAVNNLVDIARVAEQ